MEQILIWVSLSLGVVLFLCRFLPPRVRPEPSPDGTGTTPAPVRAVVMALGLLLAFAPIGLALLPDGLRLGIGFFIGGIATLANFVDVFARRPVSKPQPSSESTLLITSAYGLNIVAVVLALMFLRDALFSGLMGVAIGGLSVASALFLSLPGAADNHGFIRRRLAVGAGMLATLAAAASLGVFRDPLTPELNKQTWSAVLVAFVGVGSLLVAGTELLGVGKNGKLGRVAPLLVLVSVGGLALYQMATKITNTAELGMIGIGGMLLWAVALSVLRESPLRGVGAATTPVLAVPLLAILVVTAGFLAALQSLQGVGVAVALLGLFLAYPATLRLSESSDESGGETSPATVANGAVGLLLFGTVLILWRLFATRWAGDLRGVNLTDQYALFGLLVGAALPGLLAGIPRRIQNNEPVKSELLLGVLVLSGILTLATPAAVLVLFGAKSAVALLIGLALGAVPLLTGGTSLLPGLLAVGIALVLNQFAGTLLPAETPTRAEKIRYLAFIMSGIVVAVLLASRIGNPDSKDGAETE